MIASTLKYSVLTFTLSLLSIIIFIVPFHAFLTVWLSTGFGHYTGLRLWKEVLVLIALFGVIYLLVFDKKVRAHTLTRKLSWLIMAYLLVQLLWALVAWRSGGVTGLAALYGVLLGSRFLVFFLLAWAIAIRTDRLESRWPKLLLWPAVVVVVIGLLQVFVLPPDVLRHFGYGPETIMPVETINQNADYQRYMSTLRGPNPLGAYLLLPISALVVLLARFPRSWNWTKGLLLFGALALLIFSFSRSAWLGAMLSITFALVVAARREFWQRHRWLVAGIGVSAVALLAIGLAALQSNSALQNFVFHTEDSSEVAISSNDQRADALTGGAREFIKEPFGSGPGTAGPASVYNDQQVRLAENYYLQIGQETGIIGLAMFVSIVVGVGWLLWTRRNAPLALTLLAALVGLSFVNLLSHAWTDDTLAYIWWGLAGLAIGTPVAKPDED